MTIDADDRRDEFWQRELRIQRLISDAKRLRRFPEARELSIHRRIARVLHRYGHEDLAFASIRMAEIFAARNCIGISKPDRNDEPQNLVPTEALASRLISRRSEYNLVTLAITLMPFVAFNDIQKAHELGKLPGRYVAPDAASNFWRTRSRIGELRIAGKDVIAWWKNHRPWENIGTETEAVQ